LKGFKYNKQECAAISKYSRPEQMNVIVFPFNEVLLSNATGEKNVTPSFPIPSWPLLKKSKKKKFKKTKYTYYHPNNIHLDHLLKHMNNNHHKIIIIKKK
jgi:hypothetical protein